MALNRIFIYQLISNIVLSISIDNNRLSDRRWVITMALRPLNTELTKKQLDETVQKIGPMKFGEIYLVPCHSELDPLPDEDSNSTERTDQ